MGMSLLEDVIQSMEQAIMDNEKGDVSGRYEKARMRFAHAETLLPFSCLLGLFLEGSAIVQVLLNHDPELSKTVGTSNATPLTTTATKGHIDVVNELLLKDRTLLEISKSNGKNALHLVARQGHVEIFEEGQTTLHMAVKGTNCEVVRLLLEADATIVIGCCCLHGES